MRTTGEGPALSTAVLAAPAPAQNTFYSTPASWSRSRGSCKKLLKRLWSPAKSHGPHTTTSPPRSWRTAPKAAGRKSFLRADDAARDGVRAIGYGTNGSFASDKTWVRSPYTRGQRHVRRAPYHEHRIAQRCSRPGFFAGPCRLQNEGHPGTVNGAARLTSPARLRFLRDRSPDASRMHGPAISFHPAPHPPGGIPCIFMHDAGQFCAC